MMNLLCQKLFPPRSPFSLDISCSPCSCDFLKQLYTIVDKLDVTTRNAEVCIGKNNHENEDPQSAG